MNWRVDFSADSLKFLNRNKISDGLIIEKIKFALRKFQGERVNTEKFGIKKPPLIGGFFEV